MAWFRIAWNEPCASGRCGAQVLIEAGAMINDSSQTIRPNNNLNEVLVAGEADVVQDEAVGELIEGEGEAEVPEVIDVDDEDQEQAEDEDREGAAARVLPDP